MEMLDDFMPGEVGLIFVLFVSRFFFFFGFVLSGNLESGNYSISKYFQIRKIDDMCIACRVSFLIFNSSSS